MYSSKIVNVFDSCVVWDGRVLHAFRQHSLLRTCFRSCWPKNPRRCSSWGSLQPAPGYVDWREHDRNIMMIIMMIIIIIMIIVMIITVIIVIVIMIIMVTIIIISK
jgi:hypothetical protein